MTRRTMLIVDDDLDFAEGLSDLLDLCGWRCEIADSGAAAIRATRERDFDGVVMDIGLPDISGADTLARIREQHLGIRCVLVTGYSSHHLAAQAIDLGALKVMTKPVDIDTLLAQFEIEAPG